MDPDAVPNEYGEDPWLKAMEMSSDSNDVAGEDYLAAFLLNRALGWNSRSIGRLMFFCVQRVHQALAVERLDWNAWNLVQRRLPWASPWKAWDRCGRVRLAVVDKFVDGNFLILWLLERWLTTEGSGRNSSSSQPIRAGDGATSIAFVGT